MNNRNYKINTKIEESSKVILDLKFITPEIEKAINEIKK